MSVSVPARGDVIRLDFNPQAGHEQAGHRPALVVSPAEYNKRGMAIVCPITNTVRGQPFEVAAPPGTGVTGVILSDQMKSVDWKNRGGQPFAKFDEETVNQVVEKVLALIDPEGVFCPIETDDE